MNIWIINHYAMPPKLETRSRTLMMAKYLKELNHDVKVFCASTIHNTKINLIEKKGPLFIEENYNGLNYVHVKTSNYSGNGLSRVRNMLQFAFRLIKVARQEKDAPDVIVCDLGAPLAPIPYFISRKKKSCFIFEVRDLWPESIIEYQGLSRKNLFVKMMYLVEKWIYKKADKIVFSMEGGRDYIFDKGWDRDIDVTKIYHVNNGVDLASFNENKSRYTLNDNDLTNIDTFKVIYTGSIRPANNVRKIVEAAKMIKEKGFEKIHFIIYGEGSDRIPLMNYCNEKNISNVTFKGHVHKHFVPSVLSRSDLNILHFEQNSLKKYGSSMNKMFEYFASGKPTLSDCEFGYDIINRYKAGVSKDIISSEQFAEEILNIYNMDDHQYRELCKNALQASEDYDYKNLIDEFEKIVSK